MNPFRDPLIVLLIITAAATTCAPARTLQQRLYSDSRRLSVFGAMHVAAWRVRRCDARAR
jgi:hypothetical protein